ncbi:hypothetical protein [Ruminiclostridium cellobioparum]|uniref:hypothetical protein n=1 Tax=Ruminiclostridium cellobioparum TaxID=29355 RepID=UPI0028AA4BB7|nr:hypothetical protein [Ruminiclostridium cellobioparum]
MPILANGSYSDDIFKINLSYTDSDSYNSPLDKYTVINANISYQPNVQSMYSSAGLPDDISGIVNNLRNMVGSLSENNPLYQSLNNNVQDRLLNMSDLTFTLICGDKMYSRIVVDRNLELLNYIEQTKSQYEFFGSRTLRPFQSQTLLLLFDRDLIPKPSALGMLYIPYGNLIPIPFTYNE